jgi:Toprim domain
MPCTPTIATAQAARIAEALAGRPVKAQGGNFLVPCPAHDDASPSLSLRDGDGGLLVHCFAGCSSGDVYASIRRRDRRLLEPGNTAREPVKGSSDYERRQHDKASFLWSRRRRITGTVAEHYLRKARGITCPLPPTLAFLPPLKPEQHPAMIAAFVLVGEPEPGLLGTPRDVTSVHLTLLKPDGSGKIERTHKQPNKLIIGRPLARPIVLASPNDLLGLAICEGIEDALTAHAATGLGAWAAGSASFLSSLARHMPSFVEAVTIFAHADKAGRNGAHKLVAALQRRSIEVTIGGVAS